MPSDISQIKKPDYFTHMWNLKKQDKTNKIKQK